MSATGHTLATKLYVPPPTTTLVSRTRLLGRLHDGLRRPLTTAIAPPGFGKTTLISSWAADISRNKDPALVANEVRPFTHLPGGHAEAWRDALKNVFAQMYAAVRDGNVEAASAHVFATFEDGHRSALLVDAVLESARRKTWIELRD